MFYLRVARGYRTLDLLRWALTTIAAGIVAALLLRALGRALSDPAASHAAVLRLLWCLPALAGVAYLAAAWARAMPVQQPERIAGLLAAGLGKLRLRVLLAGEIAVACAVGALTALAGYLLLRGHVLELAPGTKLDRALAVHASLPPAAAITLLALVPLCGGLAAAAAVRPEDVLPDEDAQPAASTPGPLQLAVSAGLLTGGTAMVLAAVHTRGAVAGALGWMLAVVGLALAVPLLLHASGLVLTWGGPRAVRLLAGRGLQSEARRLGTPLAVLAIVGAVGVVAVRHYAAEAGPVGPLPRIEGVLLALCVLGALLTRLAELSGLRRAIYAPLERMGAPASTFRSAVALRSVAAVAVVLATGTATGLLATAALSI
ncbi:hypothetical protein [Streptacidiphilus monticola]|uniref:ABC transporter permease n=1 Tax=Streptacidiphilus monticola TaxID=2161674 RepID=A0ABW1FXT1_9ACTN